MEIDINVILGATLGSLIAILGSLAVAALYISNENKNKKKQRLHQRIQQTYFEQGVIPIEAALSEYGTSTIYALLDLKTWVIRCLRINNDGDILKTKIDEILGRPTIKDLTNHKFQIALKWFPALHRFGKPLYNSLKRSFQVYSRLLSDVLVLEKIPVSNIEEYIEGLTAVIHILLRTEVYLERRLEYLKDYVWRKEYEDYSDFLGISKEHEYQVFLAELEEYLRLLDKWSDSLISEQSEERKTSSLALSKWLLEHMDEDPFVNQS